MSDKNRDQAYRHQSTVVGTENDASTDPALEHQDPATGNAEQRNEIASDRGTGPSTHDDTRTTRKQGS